MYSYITEELPATVFEAFESQIDSSRVSITGHSMGGHGALTLVRLFSTFPITYLDINMYVCISDWGANRDNGKVPP